MKLIILDRDGVINQDSDAYIKTLDEWIPIPGSIDAVARLSKAGWTIAVATNQSGIGRGYYTEATLERMHERLRELVAEQGGKVDLPTRCKQSWQAYLLWVIASETWRQALPSVACLIWCALVKAIAASTNYCPRALGFLII